MGEIIGEIIGWVFINLLFKVMGGYTGAALVWLVNLGKKTFSEIDRESGSVPWIGLAFWAGLIAALILIP